MMSKSKKETNVGPRRILKVQLSCKRRGAAAESMMMEVELPEAEAMNKYYALSLEMEAALKRQGFMGGEK